MLLRAVQANATLPLAPHSPVHTDAFLPCQHSYLCGRKCIRLKNKKPFWLVIFQLDQFPALFFHMAAHTATPARTEQEHSMREEGLGLPSGTDVKNLCNNKTINN